jgi:hypothetical protein
MGSGDMRISIVCSQLLSMTSVSVMSKLKRNPDTLSEVLNLISEVSTSREEIQEISCGVRNIQKQLIGMDINITGLIVLADEKTRWCNDRSARLDIAVKSSR